MYQEMVTYLPNLVIRLNVDADTALARKPSHKVDSLRAKVAVTPSLSFNGARIVDIDSRQPYASVLSQARAVAGPIVTGRD